MVTDNQLKEITGEIQNVKSKALAIENVWYSSFTELKGYEKGQIVKIKYQINKKDNKEFRNIKAIELMGAKVIREHDDSKISDTTLNTLLMISKDMFIAEGQTNFQEILQDVFDSYNKVLRGKI